MNSAKHDLHGWLPLDKPDGMTSTEAVARVKRLFGAKKAGHAGTLDPLASGLLPIALGEATKTVPWAQQGRKTYRFTIAWGQERSTDDREGEVTATSAERPSPDEIAAGLGEFRGEILQTPPAFSAVKIAGERAYDLARAGESVDLAPRKVVIERLAVVACPDRDHAVLEAVCGKGTYVRALARDLGRRLGCFGHVASLRRIGVGPFGEADMISLETLAEMRNKAPGREAMEGLLRPLETVLDGIPALAVKDAEAQRLKQGQRVLLRGANAPVAADAVLVTWASKALAICSIEQGALVPKRLFNL